MVPLWWACTPDEEIFSELSDDSLFFSVDTVYFDTLLTTQLSPSYRVMLYNPNKRGVLIPGLSLEQGPTSPFELTVNGVTATSFSQLRILGKDSLLILLKGTLPATGQAAPVRQLDRVVVQGSASTRLVIEAWAQDATFIDELVVSDDEVWEGAAPYFITGAVLVDTLATLTIRPGVQVIMAPRANFYVKGTLKTEGLPHRPVTFRNARTDRNYAEAPGQWGGIFFLEGSKDNLLDHTVIKNGEVGVRIGTPDNDDEPDVVLSNCLIANMASDGILAFTSDVYAFNTVVYNAGRYLVGNVAGGNYRYEHCTFSNFPSDFFREGPAVVFSDNVLLTDQSLLVAPLTAFVFNSVIWGAEAEEVELNTEGGAQFVYRFANNLLKTKTTVLTENNIVNANPRFFNEFLYDYRPDSLSPLIDAARYRNIDFDIQGISRDSLPDIGAYEWAPGQKDRERG